MMRYHVWAVCVCVCFNQVLQLLIPTNSFYQIIFVYIQRYFQSTLNPFLFLQMLVFFSELHNVFLNEFSELTIGIVLTV